MSPKAATVYRCALHGYSHLYTVCPACSCQYCPRVWKFCPRISWHPAHGRDAADTGRRYTELHIGVRTPKETQS